MLEFEPERTFYFWKGRVALYTILKAMEVGAGDEIIIPGYTCVVVANAVLYLGATPVYADIDPLTYNITSEAIKPLITPRTKAIIAQNTFGLSPNLDAIMELAAQHGLYVVEDCAHGLGSSYKGRTAGTITHAAFFSTQWSKPITTGLGGIAYVSDDELLLKVASQTAELSHPSKLAEIILAMQRAMRPMANNPWMHSTLVKFYRFFTQKLGFSVGSSVGGELATIEMPVNYLRAMGVMQRKSLDKACQSLPERVQQRRAMAQKYDEFFCERNFTPPYRPEYTEHSMLRYTIRVADKAALIKKARQLHVPVGDWFVSPLHPVVGDLSQWRYQSGQCSEAEKACREGVNLLPDQEISFEKLKRLFADAEQAPQAAIAT